MYKTLRNFDYIIFSFIFFTVKPNMKKSNFLLLLFFLRPILVPLAQIIIVFSIYIYIYIKLKFSKKNFT